MNKTVTAILIAATCFIFCPGQRICAAPIRFTPYDIKAQVLKVEKVTVEGTNFLGQPFMRRYYSALLKIIDARKIEEGKYYDRENPHFESALRKEAFSVIIWPVDYEKNPVRKGMRIRAVIQERGDEFFNDYVLTDISIISRQKKPWFFWRLSRP